MAPAERSDAVSKGHKVLSRIPSRNGVEIGCRRLLAEVADRTPLFEDQRLQPLIRGSRVFHLFSPSIFPVYRVKKIGH